MAKRSPSNWETSGPKTHEPDNFSPQVAQGPKTINPKNSGHYIGLKMSWKIINGAAFKVHKPEKFFGTNFGFLYKLLFLTENECFMSKKNLESYQNLGGWGGLFAY